MGAISERADRFVAQMMKQHRRMPMMEEQPKKMMDLYSQLRSRRKQMQKKMKGC